VHASEHPRSYASIPIESANYGFRNVIDNENLQDLEAPTEHDNEKEVFKWRTGCAYKAGLHKVKHEDRDDNLGVQ
jgi:hypothetical protein